MKMPEGQELYDIVMSLKDKRNFVREAISKTEYIVNQKRMSKKELDLQYILCLEKKDFIYAVKLGRVLFIDEQRIQTDILAHS
jgi:hypothetical protein